MIILKATKKQGFILSLEDIFFEKNTGGSSCTPPPPPSFFRVKLVEEIDVRYKKIKI